VETTSAGAKWLECEKKCHTFVLGVAQVLQQSVQLGQVVVDVLALRRGDGFLNDALLRGKRLQKHAKQILLK